MDHHRFDYSPITKRTPLTNMDEVGIDRQVIPLSSVPEFLLTLPWRYQKSCFLVSCGAIGPSRTLV